MSEDLERAGATWDDDPSAGEWILPLLGDPGASLGAHVPQVFDAYAVVPFPRDDDGELRYDGEHDRLEALLDVLAPRTGDQPVHVGLWEGWGYLYDHGDDPTTAPGMAALVASEGRPRWWQRGRRATTLRDDLRQAQAEAEAEAGLADIRVERPAAAPLDMPYMGRFLWTGPLRSATALRRFGDLPSLVWPDDRSWFVGIPEYTGEMALGGPNGLVDVVLAEPRLEARSATPSTVLDVND